MAADRRPLPDFPTMYGFSEPLMAASEETGNPDFRFLLYGQAAALNRELPAADLIAHLIDEAQGVLSRS
jgi:nitronate monooxygenase